MEDDSLLGKLLTLPEIFNNAVFRIPDYQRGYAWTDKELQDFWDDLDLLSSHSSQPHYVGVLTLEKVPQDALARVLSNGQEWLQDGGQQFFYVVDGQQRLTTILIGLFELIKWHKELSPGSEALTAGEDRDSVMSKYIRCKNKFVPQVFGYRLGYASDDQTDAFLRREVFEDGSVSQSIRQSAYTQNLLIAKNFFAKKLRKMPTTVDLQGRFKLIVERLRFNIFEVNSDLDVCRTFEAINNRGKSLSDLEKLKSRLAYLAVLLAGHDSNLLAVYRKQINDRWKKVYGLLGWSPEVQLDDDEFLNLTWIIYFGRYGDISRTDHLFKQQFFPRTIQQQGWSPIECFTSTLANAVAPWVAMEYPKQIPSLLAHKELARTVPGRASSYLEKLSRLGASAFRPLILAALLRHQEGRINDDQLCKLLEASERYVFIVLGLSDRRSDTGRNKYFRKAHELYENPEAEIVNLISEIRQDADNWFDASRFISIVREWYEKCPQKGFYGWSELRYVLFEYEQHLYDTIFTTNSGKSPLLWTSVVKEKLEESIEHIYPQTATDTTWTQEFGQDSNSSLLNALGNLLLLSQSKNSSLQNRPYAEKAHGVNNYPNPYKNGSCSEHMVASTWKAWTPQSVCERTKELLKFIGKRWDIDADKWQIVQGEILTNIVCPSCNANVE